MNSQTTQEQFIENIILKAMVDVKEKTNFKNDCIESLVAYRSNCLIAIYSALEVVDFSQYQSIFENLQIAIREKNKQFALDGEGLKVNEEKFSVNYFYKICSSQLLNVNIFRDNENAIEEFIAQKARQEDFQRRSKVKFNQEEHQSLMHTDVLWAGWELDYTAWIIQENGKNILLTSDHGEIKETDKKFLQDKIKEYELAIENSKKMLQILN